jgi:hypothetical protein
MNYNTTYNGYRLRLPMDRDGCSGHEVGHAGVLRYPKQKKGACQPFVEQSISDTAPRKTRLRSRSHSYVIARTPKMSAEAGRLTAEYRSSWCPLFAPQLPHGNVQATIACAHDHDQNVGTPLFFWRRKALAETGLSAHRTM